MTVGDRDKNGDVAIPCPDCQGFGIVEAYVTKPWRVGDAVECERCKGSGEIWVEGEIEE